jgi:hypothetical protein
MSNLEFPPVGIATGINWMKDTEFYPSFNGSNYPKYKTSVSGSNSWYGAGEYVAFANSLYDSYGTDEWPPAGAFDKTSPGTGTRTGWHTATGHTASSASDMSVPAILGLALPTFIRLKSYAITLRTDASVPTQAPQKWNLYGGTYQSDYTLLETRDTQTGWTGGSTRTYTLTNSNTSFNTFRFDFLRNNGSTAVSVGELRFYGDIDPTKISVELPPPMVVTSTSWNKDLTNKMVGFCNDYATYTTTVQRHWYGTGQYTAFANSINQYVDAPSISGTEATPAGAFDRNDSNMWQVQENHWHANTVDTAFPSRLGLVAPCFMRLQAYSIKLRTDAYQFTDQAPTKWNLYGGFNQSNYQLIDTRVAESNWTLKSRRLFNITQNSNVFYNTFMVEFLRCNTPNGSNLLSLSDLRFYGDLDIYRSSFEYPPFAITNSTWTKDLYDTLNTYAKSRIWVNGTYYGIGEYVAAANDIYSYSSTSNVAGGEWGPSRAFDKLAGNSPNPGFAAASSVYLNSVDGPPANLLIQLPQYIRLQSYEMAPRSDDASCLQQPIKWRLFGGIDQSNYVEIDFRENQTTWTAGAFTSYSNINSTNTAFNTFLLQILRINIPSTNVPSIGELRFYGVPQSNVLDSPILEFPPVGIPAASNWTVSSNDTFDRIGGGTLTKFKATLSNLPYGNGTYTAFANSWFIQAGNADIWAPQGAFDKILSINSVGYSQGWASAQIVSPSVDSTNPPILGIVLPTPIRLKYYTIRIRSDYVNQAPTKWRMYAGTQGINFWGNQIDDRTIGAWSLGESRRFTIVGASNNLSCDTFVWQFLRGSGSGTDVLGLMDISLFGTLGTTEQITARNVFEYPPPSIPSGNTWIKDTQDTITGRSNVVYTRYKTFMRNTPYGNGMYVAWANSVLNYNASANYNTYEWAPSMAFDKRKLSSSTLTAWASADAVASLTSAVSPAYSLYIQLPQRIALQSYSLSLPVDPTLNAASSCVLLVNAEGPNGSTSILDTSRPPQSAASTENNPTLTSNTSAQGFVASASAEYVTGGGSTVWGAWRAFNGVTDASQVYFTTGGAAPGWVQLRYPYETVLQSYMIFPDSVAPVNNPRAWTMQGSLDGVTWVTLDTRSSITWSGTTSQTFTTQTRQPCRIFRLNVTELAGLGWVTIIELRLTTLSVSYLSAVNNAQISTAQRIKGTSSLFFPNSGTGYVLAASSPNYAFASGNFTIEFWMYWSGVYSTTGAGWTRIMGNSMAVWGANAWVIGWDNQTNNGTARMGMQVNNIGTWFSTTTAIPATTWTHYAFVRNGNSFYAFMNGTLQATFSSSLAVDAGTSYPMVLGGNPGDSQYFYGHMDQVRIHKGAALYTRSFTPSFNVRPAHSPMAWTVHGANDNGSYTQLHAVSHSNLVLYLDAETGTARDFGPATSTVTSVNSAQVSTTQKRYGGYSLFFPNNGSAYYLVSSSPLYALGSGDFTIEFWMYWSGTYSTSGGGWQRLMSNSTSTWGANTWAIGWDNVTNNGTARMAFTPNNAASFYSTTTAIPATTWVHYAFVRSGTSLLAFMNGTLQASHSLTQAVDAGTSYPVAIGALPGESQYFYGFLDKVRILKGVAMYTSSFTPQYIPPPTRLSVGSETMFQLPSQSLSQAQGYNTYRFDFTHNAAHTADFIVVGDIKLYGTPFVSARSTLSDMSSTSIMSATSLALVPTASNIRLSSMANLIPGASSTMFRASDLMRLNPLLLANVPISRNTPFRLITTDGLPLRASITTPNTTTVGVNQVDSVGEDVYFTYCNIPSSTPYLYYNNTGFITAPNNQTLYTLNDRSSTMFCGHANCNLTLNSSNATAHNALRLVPTPDQSNAYYIRYLYRFNSNFYGVGYDSNTSRFNIVPESNVPLLKRFLIDYTGVPIFDGLDLCLDANMYTTGSAIWYDKSGNGRNFMINSGASRRTLYGNIRYMDFEGGYGLAKTVSQTNVGPHNFGTLVIFSTILNSTYAWRTLTRGADNATHDHQVIIQNGVNTLGMYDSGTASFRGSGFNINTIPRPYHNFHMYAFKLNSITAPFWEFTLNSNNAIASTGSDANATFNTGFSTIGGYHNNNTSDPNAGSQFWGKIATLLYYNRNLTYDEIGELYRRYAPRFPTASNNNYIMYYPNSNEVAGTAFNRFASGYALTLPTVVNGAYYQLTPAVSGVYNGMYWQVFPGSTFTASFDMYVGAGTTSLNADSVSFSWFENNIPSDYQGETVTNAGYKLSLQYYLKQTNLCFASTTLATPTMPFNIDNETWRQVVIKYQNGVVQCYVSGSSFLSFTDSFRSQAYLSSTFMGFSSRTGGENAINRIRNFQVLSLENVVTNGLVAWFDPSHIDCYSGSGATLRSLIGNATAGLTGSYSFSSGRIRLTNTSATNTANVSSMHLSTLSNIQTVSIWYFQHSAPTFRYLLDARNGVANSYLYNDDNSQGPVWSSGTMYKNGGPPELVRWTNIETLNTWQNITVIASSQLTDDMTIFGRFSSNDALDVTFGPIMVYNRVLSQAENQQNFLAYRSYFQVNPFDNLVSNGLTLYFDPANTFSYGGSARRLTSLVGTATGTIGGTYAFSNNNIRLFNTSDTSSTNVSFVGVSSITNITTVSMWFYQHNSSNIATARYLLDMRGGSSNGWLWNVDANQGTAWSAGTLYKNGGAAQTLNWSNIESPSNWQHVTLITNTPTTDDITLFARVSSNEGLDATFGPIQIYNRAITRSENLQNFNAFRARYISYPVDNVVTDGLIAWIDPNNPYSYPGSGTNMSSLVFGAIPVLNGSFSNVAGRIRLFNTSGTAAANTARLQFPTMQNTTTISTWIYQHSSPANRYLLDMRSGVANGWIWSYDLDQGSFWTSGGTLYKNTSNPQGIRWSNIEALNTWQNVTVVSSSNGTDDITLFAAFDGTQGLDVTFGPILIYNRALSQAEHLQNFNAYRPQFIPLLPSIITSGLILWIDPANTASYSGTGASFTSLVGSATCTVGGSYTFTAGRMRLINSSTTINANTAYLQASTLTNVQTISIWYFQHFSPGATRYLVDLRTGVASGWIISPEIDPIGTFWSSGTLYVNGGAAQSVTWPNIERIGVWQNITVVSPSQGTDDVTFFSRYTFQHGLDVTFGPIMVYDREISQAENLQNFNAYKSQFGLL